MARTEEILSVFVASPSDVADERTKLEEIIQELNMTWSREIGLRFELVRWETHALPGFDSEPQQVINNSVPLDYDIFIGIMWCKFGTPTAGFGSGTIEEFELAKRRADSAPSTVKIMFYFRDSAPSSLSQLNGEELIKIDKFRNGLGDEGILYWRYNNLTDFEKFVRLHLSKQIQNWRQGKTNSISKSFDVEIKIDNNDDLGVLELQEIAELQFGQLAEIISRISSYLIELKELNETATIDLNIASQYGDADPTKARREGRNILQRIAIHLDNFSDRIEAEIPLFKNSLSEGLNSIIKTIEISVDFSHNESYKNDMIFNRSTISDTLNAMDGALHAFYGFLSAVEGLPRIISDINRSKRRVISTMGSLVDEMNVGRRLVQEIISTIDAKLASIDAL